MIIIARTHAKLYRPRSWYNIFFRHRTVVLVPATYELQIQFCKRSVALINAALAHIQYQNIIYDGCRG